MSKRNILLGIVGLGVLWVVAFFVANTIINQVDDTDSVLLPTPTQRPIRTDVPELRAATATPEEVAQSTPEPTEEPDDSTPEPTDEPTQEPTEEPTQEPQDTPTPRFTLSSLEVQRFRTEQQQAFTEDFLAAAAKATVEIDRDADGGAYPIQLAIEDLELLAPVLVVQTDPDFNIVTPREEVGYYALTPKIGSGGNSVMVGHVYPGRVFNRLLDVEVGAVIRVTDEFFEEHYYRVTEIIRFPYEVGNDEDRELGFQYMYDQSEERLTLVTCYPEYEWTHRFVVRAEPIDADEVED